MVKFVIYFYRAFLCFKGSKTDYSLSYTELIQNNNLLLMVEGKTLEEKCSILQKFLHNNNSKNTDQNLLIKLKNDKSYKFD